MPKAPNQLPETAPTSGAVFSENLASQPQNWLHVATLTQPHGLKGEMKLKLFTASTENVQIYGTFHTERLGTLTLSNLRGSEKSPIATFTEIPDRTTAESAKSVKLYIHINQRPNLSDDEVYLSDILGMPVLLNGTKMGTLRDVFSNGAQDVLEIQRPEGTDILVPWVDDFVEDITDEAILLTPDAEAFWG